MISNLVEVLGFGFATFFFYEIAGKAGALACLAVVFLVVGLALDGVTLRIPRFRKPEPPKRRRRSEEPLTNEKLDQR